jgi:hypothetical protein
VDRGGMFLAGFLAGALLAIAILALGIRGLL